jgi:hypothetical protein
MNGNMAYGTGTRDLKTLSLKKHQKPIKPYETADILAPFLGPRYPY